MSPSRSCSASRESAWASDYGDSVDHANYKPTFPFTGTVKEVRFDLTAEAIQNADVETMHGMSKQ